VSDTAAWPIQGLIRHFTKDIEDLDNPAGFDHEAKAWSGDPFDNAECTKAHGAGKTYATA
jgi:NADH dehydrogenase (ubiquinone) flavoprotein 1